MGCKTIAEISVTLVYSFVFILGLFVGSFINVLIYRTPRNESVLKPRSHCPVCGKVLNATELFPVVSFIILRARCKNCNSRISPRYPVVESLIGFLFLLTYIKYGFSFEFFCYSAFFSLLTAISFIDAEFMIIPNRLVFYAFIISTITFAYNTIFPLAIYGNANPFYPLLGLLPGAVFFFLINVGALLFFKSDNSIGMGDVKLLIPIGIVLGFKSCLVAVLISVMLGGLVGVVLIILRKKKKRDRIPFGPFIVLGAYLALILAGLPGLSL